MSDTSEREIDASDITRPDCQRFGRTLACWNTQIINWCAAQIRDPPQGNPWSPGRWYRQRLPIWLSCGVRRRIGGRCVSAATFGLAVPSAYRIDESRINSMAGFWSSETMKNRLPGLIAPFDGARIVNCSYELTMGDEAHITGEGAQTKCRLAENEQLQIPPGQFAQLLTQESVTIPEDSIGLISMKFTLKSRGLVNVSGFHVDPGYRGRLIFSVYNAGPNSIVISRGQPTFLMWYSFLDRSTSDLYDKRRAGLTSISDENVMRLQGNVSTPQALVERVVEVEKWLATFRRWSGVVLAAIITALIGAIITVLIAFALNQLRSSENGPTGELDSGELSEQSLE